MVDEASSSSLTSASEESSEAEAKNPAPDDFIALLTYSPSPYDDFRRSMQEMVDARVEHNGKVDWEFLEELLFCYLDLNNKKSYRYILRAFVDLIVLLRENSGTVPAIRPSLGGRGWRKQLN
ncbi:transcription repressor ofp14 [Phtheirospermum japonicum]|uniref:Transcription repressor n=1 Tax=Phtheirospermum japonicum TaxID=374723 RepID=A0A830BMX6_9LAMI|nr:transcription repressor ofp14 [Phtheirospermum japonicum]